ncbi:nucleolar pre-ribosomal-associated protein 1 [Biomphalaria glabrata]|uniref:Uncharacterized protein LOC106077843 n=1 Tax=Biomphalaria glabrata TaxID=6526 RepID=A0A9U8ELQ8_BIOGL|nr:uncharacterized protein LOC106077843 [Biomphalaria glabrata]KAI8727934.1 hypothetical protein BgiMline_033217 [Biomphalaria glabrata]
MRRESYLCVLIACLEAISGNVFTEREIILHSNVKIKIDPAFLIDDLSSEVNIRCSFSRGDVPSMTAVVSLSVAYSNSTSTSYEDLAFVNEVEGHPVNLSREVQVISGSVDNNGESTLLVQFKYPNTKMLGAYLCSIKGLDDIGRPLSIFSTANLTSYSLNTVIDTIYELEANRSASEALVSSLQACVDKQTGLIDSLNKRIYPMLAYGFSASSIFNGHRYYLSTHAQSFSFGSAEFLCNGFGGYVVEIDTHEEFVIVRNFISSFNITEAVWTGATYEAPSGVWVNKHSSTTPNFEWAPGEPANNTCQCFHSKFKALLGTCECDNITSASSYVCEIPQQTC